MREVRISKHRKPAADAKSAREGLEHIYEGGTTEVSAESPTRKGHAQGCILNFRRVVGLVLPGFAEIYVASGSVWILVMVISPKRFRSSRSNSVAMSCDFTKVMVLSSLMCMSMA